MRIHKSMILRTGLLLGLISAGGVRAETMVVTFEGLKNPIVNESRFQGAVEALGIEFRSTTGVDMATLMTSGKRRVSTLVISKRYGATSSPQLLEANDVNQPLKSVKVDFLAVDANGRDVLLYSWRLTNAYVVDVDVRQDAKDGAKAQVMERIGFGFQTIDVIVGGKVVASMAPLVPIP